MSVTDVRGITELAIEAARGAGRIALEGFRAPDLEIDLKRDFHDLVTEFDRRSEEHIRARIREAFPGSAIIGEEGGRSGSDDAAAPGEGAQPWHVDPIDGTSNFARGMALWAVCIGAEIDGEMVSGVVYDPVNDQLFWADERGAFLNDEPLVSRGSAEPSQATVISDFPLPRDLVHFPDLALAQLAELSTAFSQRRSIGSSAVALCWVAAGWADATFCFGVSSWDVAAAGFIVRRAGGVYETYLDGERRPEERDFENPHYYAHVPEARFDLIHRLMREQSRRP